MAERSQWDEEEQSPGPQPYVVGKNQTGMTATRLALDQYYRGGETTAARRIMALADRLPKPAATSAGCGEDRRPGKNDTPFGSPSYCGQRKVGFRRSRTERESAIGNRPCPDHRPDYYRRRGGGAHASGCVCSAS